MFLRNLVLAFALTVVSFLVSSKAYAEEDNSIDGILAMMVECRDQNRIPFLVRLESRWDLPPVSRGNFYSFFGPTLSSETIMGAEFNLKNLLRISTQANCLDLDLLASDFYFDPIDMATSVMNNTRLKLASLGIKINELNTRFECAKIEVIMAGQTRPMMVVSDGSWVSFERANRSFCYKL